MTTDTLIDALSGYIETLSDGTICYRNAQGQTHRTNGPAIVYATGEQHWYQNGELHRIDGPAIVYPGGNKCWYRNGLLHRTDGPANIFNGISHWYLNGMRLSEEEFNRRVASGEYRDP